MYQYPDGSCFWVTGLPGSGKTTISSEMKNRIGKHVIFLDGDEMRESLKNLVQGYDNESRQNLALTYSRLCKMLSDQGHIVIMATVSMFDIVRKWNKENIKHYYEIFLDTSMDVLIERDQKKLYSEKYFGSHLLKSEMGCEFPKSPNIKVHNNGDFSVESIVDSIMFDSNCHFKKMSEAEDEII